MLARSLHVVLTYRCLHRCDVCHLHAGPDREGTFTRTELDRVLAEAGTLASLERLVFTGGEPFLYYPLLYQGIRQARSYGFDLAVTTTADWARDESTSVAWLAPLRTAGLRELCVAEHPWDESPARREKEDLAARVARSLGFTVSKEMHVVGPDRPGQPEGSAVHQGAPYPHRGRGTDVGEWNPPPRAVRQSSCPLFDDPQAPLDIWIEPEGTVQVCQGIMIGSLWWGSLREIVGGFHPERHPILAPLARGGPAALAETFGMDPDQPAVDGCQLCTRVRVALRDRFPEELGPESAYGMRDGHH